MKGFDGKEVPEFDYGLIKERFDRAILTVANIIDRKWPEDIKQHPGSRSLLRGIYHGAVNTYRALRYLIADQPPDSARRPEYVLAASPLTRALVDALSTVVYLFGDLPRKTLLFYRSGWRDVARENARLSASTAADAEFLKGHTMLAQHLKTQAGITAAEESDLTLVKTWPTPGKMLHDPRLQNDRKEFLQYMVDWFYKTLSEDAHFNWTGLARSLPLLSTLNDAENRELKIQFLRTRQVAFATTVMLCIATEFELELKMGVLAEVKYVWSILRDWSHEADEIYRRFYEPFLGSATVPILQTPTG